MKTKREYNVSAITKMLAILDFLEEAPGSSFLRIYTELDLPKSSTYQILQALIARGIVRKGEDGKFYLGLKMFEYGQAAVLHIDVRQAARPILAQLAKDTGLTVHLGILNEQDDGIFLDRFDGASFTFTHTKVGARITMETSATGRALITWQTEEKREQLINKLNFTLAERSLITSKDAYREECAKAQARGYTIDLGESQPNINGVGVPIYDYTGRLCAAIALGGLYNDLNAGNRERPLQLLKRAAEELSKELGKY